MTVFGQDTTLAIKSGMALKAIPLLTFYDQKQRKIIARIFCNPRPSFSLRLKWVSGFSRDW